MIGVAMEGGKKLNNQLMKLERKVAKKIVRSATRKGAKPTLVAAKANAMSMVGGVMGGKLKKNLAIKALVKQRKGSYGVRVMIKPDEELISITKEGKRHYIPAAIEFGHDNAAAVPFMRNAADSRLKQGAGIMQREIINGIKKAKK